MSKSVVLTLSQWEKLKVRLRKDYAPSVTMIREKMKEVLGFVDREHREWIKQDGFQLSGSLLVGGPACSRMITTVHLDFYNESKRTMFILKYSEYLHKSD